MRSVDLATLHREIEMPSRLLIDAEVNGDKTLSVAYAPFDHLARGAQVVIVGLTPGRQQMRNALIEARKLLRSEASDQQAQAGAKVYASFSGPMRNNLVEMLDHIGVNRLLGLSSTAELWGPASDLVHFTSALRYPVFVNDANYSGTPNMLRTPLLRGHLSRWFGSEVQMLRDAIFVPLGSRVDEALQALAVEHRVDARQIPQVT